LVWIRVPTVSASASTTIYFYYDELQDGSEYNSPSDVWADYAGVWHMNDATTSTILDSTSNDNDGTKKAANEPIEAIGQIGKAQDFDGVNDYVNVPHSASLNITDAITVEAWINIKSYVKNGGILNKYVNTAVGSWFLALSDAPPYDKLYWKFYDVDDVIHTGVSTKSLSLNQWYHIVWTYDSVTPNIYVNGFAESFPAINKALRLSLDPVNIGDVANNHFNGTIDESQVCADCWSPAWVGASYETQRDHFIYATSPVRCTVTDTDTLSGNGIAFLAFCAAIATLGVVLLMNKKMKRR